MMVIKVSQYVPVLKWRQGEYQALSRLTNTIKDSITPLIIIPPVEYDFEEKKLKKTTQEHVETFPKRLHSKWGKKKALIDLHSSLEESAMDDGRLAVEYIFDELRKTSCAAIPVVKLSNKNEYMEAVKRILLADQNGVCIRITLPELINVAALNMRLQMLTHNLDLVYAKIDLVIDLERPESFEPYTIFSKALTNNIKKIADIQKFRSFALVGTSLRLTGVKRPGGELIRHEWHLYNQLVIDLHTIRIPTYGDYSIETPDFSAIDMRKIRPSGKIVYTSDDVWFVAKGPAFRGNEYQMVEHCKTIVNSVHWCGAKYSNGDLRINSTLLGTENTGNLSTWKQVGVSHHLVKVVEQLSKLHAS